MSDRYTKYECIKTELTDSILTVTLNRPQQYNAVNHQLHHELGNIFYDIALDDEVSVVIVTGEGKAFCAGGDLKAMHQFSKENAGGSESYMSSVDGKRIIYSLLDLEKPVICKLNRCRRLAWVRQLRYFAT